jgi:hypothetical protein
MTAIQIGAGASGSPAGPPTRKNRSSESENARSPLS